MSKNTLSLAGNEMQGSSRNRHTFRNPVPGFQFYPPSPNPKPIWIFGKAVTVAVIPLCLHLWRCTEANPRQGPRTNSPPLRIVCCRSVFQAAFGVTRIVLVQEFTCPLKITLSKYTGDHRALSRICPFAFAVILHDQC